MVPIAYASSEGSDEPVHLRKIVSAFRLNCEHRRNVDEGTFINFRIIAPLGGCEFENRKNSLYFNHHTSIDSRGTKIAYRAKTHIFCTRKVYGWNFVY